jgi:Phage Terminase
MATCDPVCIRCHQPVDMTLPRNSKWGASADHEPPLALTGELLPSMDGAGIAHLDCNRKHGASLGKKLHATTPSRSLRVPRSLPVSPATYTPKVAGKAKSAPERPDIDEAGWIRPRLETRAPEIVRGTHGAAAAEWLLSVYGMTLRGWQRHALDRALEHDQEGRLVWSVVVLTVGRQSGKSWLSRGICMWRLHHAHLFGEPQTILHMANKRDTAMEVLRPAGMWALERYGKGSVRWGNTSAGILLPSGDRWLIHAANESAGVGYSCSMVFADESWAISRNVIDDAVMPTMSEREQPQLWLVSTAGDSSSDLMIQYRSSAIEQLDAPAGTLLLEWSAPADADPDDPETWVWASPEWTEKRQAFVARQHATLEESSFRRQWCNQWVTKAGGWLKDSQWLDTTSDLGLPEGATWTVAVESAFDGQGHAVAVAGVLDDERVVVRVSTMRTIKQVDERLAELRAQHPMLFVIVTPGYVDRLHERFDELVGQREAVAGTQSLLDLFDRRAILHDGGLVLREHLAASRISKRDAGWVLSSAMGAGPSYAARAVMFAAAQATKRQRPTAIIHSRRRA